MFCPKCSQAQPADDLRFCPRCGFPLIAVKELLGREGKRGGDGTGAGEEWGLPAQKDLTTGALLMFAGSVVTVLWGFMGSRGPAEALLPQAYFILGGTLAFLLTLFHPLLRTLEKLFSGEPSPYPRGRRDGINLGALLMFVGALKATLLTSGMHPGPERGLTALAFMAGMLLLTLLLRPALRVAHGLLFKGDKSSESPAAEATTRLDSQEHGRALPPAQSIPVNDFSPSGHDTAELAAAPSVVEETTRKLER